MEHNIGIMQGRLTRPKGRGIQFFPFDNWKEEFYMAQEIGIDEIEFIFDYNDYVINPLWTDEGVEDINNVITDTNVSVNAVCFDYFMRRPFFKSQKEYELLKKENTNILLRVIESMNKLGIDLIEIPLIDNSSIKSREEKDEFKNWILNLIGELPSNVRIGLETDLEPFDFLEYINEFDNERIGANYDSGNSSGMGYDLYEEVTTLKDHIFNIHIKDRVYHGTTVQLGNGSADFEKLFKGLKKINYRHDFILQAARGDEGMESTNIVKQMDFVKKYIEKYNV